MYEPVKRAPSGAWERAMRSDEGEVRPHILSNPPFVAVPSAKVETLAPALYSSGGCRGGRDGMRLLRLILDGCFDALLPRPREGDRAPS